jgi:hypothetical protein
LPPPHTRIDPLTCANSPHYPPLHTTPHHTPQHPGPSQKTGGCPQNRGSCPTPTPTPSNSHREGPAAGAKHPGLDNPDTRSPDPPSELPHPRYSRPAPISALRHPTYTSCILDHPSQVPLGCSVLPAMMPTRQLPSRPLPLTLGPAQIQSLRHPAYSRSPPSATLTRPCQTRRPRSTHSFVHSNHHMGPSRRAPTQSLHTHKHSAATRHSLTHEPTNSTGANSNKPPIPLFMHNLHTDALQQIARTRIGESSGVDHL